MTMQYKKIFFAASVFMCAIAAIFYFFVHGWQTERIARARQEARQLSGELAALKLFLHDHPDVDDYAADIELREEENRALMPLAMDTSAFMGELQFMALQSNAKLLGMMPEAAENKNGYYEQHIVINFKGNYFEVLDFLKILEHGGRFVTVHGVGGRADENGIFSGTMDISIYSYEKK